MIILLHEILKDAPPVWIEPIQQLPDAFAVVIDTPFKVSSQEVCDLLWKAVRKTRDEYQLNAAFQVAADLNTSQPTEIRKRPVRRCFCRLQLLSAPRGF